MQKNNNNGTFNSNDKSFYDISKMIKKRKKLRKSKNKIK
jgi:hypothetical protein